MTIIAHQKKKLTFEEQIVHMKEKGISFQICSEESAIAYLKAKNNYYRLAAFRKLFPKYEGGEHNGRYIQLDFGQLRDLSYLDQNLRSAFLSMALDIEHYEKIRILKRITESADEDGYSIVVDYKDSLAKKRAEILEHEIGQHDNDTYCGSLLQKYRHDMPVWVFLEIMSFGRFIDFCRFCAERWSDKALRDEHYMLKKVKSIRNAAAHGTYIINGFAETENTEVNLPSQVSQSIARMNISKARRNSKLANARMREIATLLYLHDRIVRDGESKNKAKDALHRIFSSFNEAHLYPENSLIFSSISFIEALTKGYSLS